MKTKFSLYLLLSVLLTLQSCGVSEVENKIRQAEDLMLYHQDSALIIMESINPLDLKSKREKALYALTTTAARYKNRIKETDDSLLRIALDYYDNRTNDIHRALSFFYLAQIKRNQGNNCESIINLLEAEQTAKLLGDSLQLGLIYRSLGDVYEILWDNKTSLLYQQMALQSFLNSSTDKYTNYQYFFLARAYQGNFEYEKSNEIFEIALGRATEDNDTILVGHILRNQIPSFIELGDYAKAHEKDSLLDMIPYKYQYSKGFRWRNKGIIAIEKDGDLHEAQRCNDSLHVYTPDEQYLTYLIEAGKGNDKKARELLKNEIKEQNDLIKEISSTDLSDMVKEYYTLKRRKDQEYGNLEKERLYIILGFIFIISVLVILFFRQRYMVEKEKRIRDIGKLNENVFEKESIISRLSSEISEKDRELMSVKNKSDQLLRLNETNLQNARGAARELVKSRFDLLNSLCEAYYMSGADGERKGVVYKEVQKQIKSLSEDEGVYLEFEKIINASFDNLMMRFSAQMPSLREGDRKLFMLTTLGFTANAISILMDYTVKSVYTKKSRLRDKIGKASCPDRDLFLSSLH